MGYISVVEELKVVTETNITTTTTVSIEEKYKVVAPEAMQETFMSDSEDEGGSYVFLLIYLLFWGNCSDKALFFCGYACVHCIIFIKKFI